MAKILVVDDEASIRFYLKETLINDGHEVTGVESGEEAVELATRQEFDLALLDLMLGEMSGLDVLNFLRCNAPDTIVILLTAHATVETAVEALRQGAQDYLFKPCKTVELRQSIRQGLLKRHRTLQQRSLLHQLEQHLVFGLDELRATMDVTPPESQHTTSNSLSSSLLSIQGESKDKEPLSHWGDLVINLSQRLVMLEDHSLELSPTEFELLAYLINQAPRVVSAQELVREVQGYSSEPWEAKDIVRQHIYNIRQKFKNVTGRADVIRTVRGVGYTINERFPCYLIEK